MKYPDPINILNPDGLVHLPTPGLQGAFPRCREAWWRDRDVGTWTEAPVTCLECLADPPWYRDGRE